MQTNALYQNPVISKLLISFLTVIAIVLICLVAHQILQEIKLMLPFMRQELSNVAAETLYIR